MICCIWNKKGEMFVVEIDEYNKLMAAGDYFDNPSLKKNNEENSNGKSKTRSIKQKQSRRSGHDLQSSKPGDDCEETSNQTGGSKLRRGDDEHRRESASDSSQVNEGDWPRVSSEVKDAVNVTAAEDYQ